MLLKNIFWLHEHLIIKIWNIFHYICSMVLGNEKAGLAKLVKTFLESNQLLSVLRKKSKFILSEKDKSQPLQTHSSQNNIFIIFFNLAKFHYPKMLAWWCFQIKLKNNREQWDHHNKSQKSRKSRKSPSLDKFQWNNNFGHFNF